MTSVKQNLQEMTKAMIKYEDLKKSEFTIETPTKKLKLLALITTLMECIEPSIKEKYLIDNGRFIIFDGKLYYKDLDFGFIYGNMEDDF